jgi:hypothetical protein
MDTLTPEEIMEDYNLSDEEYDAATNAIEVALNIVGKEAFEQIFYTITGGFNEI